jgi:hypothetical protein
VSLRRRTPRTFAGLLLLGACLVSDAWADDRVTERVSTGPSGGNAALHTCNGLSPDYRCQTGATVAMSEDGTHVVFSTPEALTPDDTDSLRDVYERSAGVTHLVSTGPLGSPGAATLEDVSADGSSVFFTTAAQLVPEDSDTLTDVYARVGGASTLLVSTGPLDSGNVSAVFSGNAPDGDRVFFSTTAALTADDTDTSSDLYERSGGTTRLVSRLACPATCFPGVALGVFADGSHVAFSLGYQGDSRNDLYVSSLAGGQWTPQLVSRPPSQTSNAAPDFKYLSHDGSRVYFTTTDVLAPGHAPGSRELYVHSPSGFELVSTGPLNECTFNCSVGFWVGLSADETHVYFTTGKRLEPADTDTGGGQDLYERVGSTTSVLTPGAPSCGTPNNCLINFEASSADGARVIFTTDEALAPGGGSGDYNLYERDGGVTTLLTPPAGFSFYATDPAFVGASEDATRVLFTTGRPLTPNDTDPPLGCYWDDGDGDVFDADCIDLYAREDGVFTLLSKGPSGGDAALEVYPNDWTPEDLAASKDAQRAAFFTREALTPDDTDGLFDDLYLSAPAVTTGQVFPRGATPMTLPLVPAFQPCGAPNRTHGAPLSFGSCAPPFATSGQLTIGSPEANGQAANSVSWATVKVMVGNSSTTADEADVRLRLHMTDVRRSDLSDYTGELEPRFGLRLTDRDGGVPSTVTDSSFSFAVPCAGTASTNVGSTCDLATTADAVTPGIVKESLRSIWALDRLQVYDGGTDGLAGTAGDNALFAIQGVFVP